MVGGDDSAVEAAVGLSEQPGCDVTLSYRRDAFARIKAKNESRLEEASAAGRVRLLLRSEVTAIEEGEVHLRVARADGATEVAKVPNDDVFVMAGGVRCADCHNPPEGLAAFTCTNCHEHARGEMAKKHRKVRRYAYRSAASLDCHPDSRERDD